MRELNINESNAVAAGTLPLLGVLAWVWVDAENIQTAFEGFFDGFGEALEG